MVDARDLERRRYEEAGVADYRSMFDREYLGAWDLEGKDRIVKISKVVGVTLTAPGNKKNKKPVIWFHGKEKGLALNKTNAKIIASLYGPDTDNWIDKEITIFPTTTGFGGETVECIRVRPQVPQRRRTQKEQPPAEPLPNADDPGAEKEQP